MRAIMVMFDTLSKRFLSTYGSDWTITPNFKRLEEKCVIFDNFYGGSMPCMPARRELHTGRYNFLHRGWGPLEPFDCSIMEELKRAGIYTHLVTDHSHYFEDGGATYHNRYDTWEGFRGQEGDRWVPQICSNPELNKNPLNKQGISAVQHYANRSRITCEEDMPSVKTINAGLEFLDCYKTEENWFLQIECFDPHEPFYVPEKYRQLYHCGILEEAFNWPPYKLVGGNETKDKLDDLKKEYAALITMCDYHLGRILDFMDENRMWEDTMLIVNTDHGFLLGERGFMGKNYMPMYEEIIHIPFYMHDPRYEKEKGRRSELAQTIDIAPTLLEYFNVDLKDYEMDGMPLTPILNGNKKIHDNILFGIHGGHINIYDGKHMLMKSPEKINQPLVSWTLMPANMRGFYKKEILEQGVLISGGRFTNGIPCMKYEEQVYVDPLQFGDLLFDLEADPEQENPLDDLKIMQEMCVKLKKAMDKAEAPEEEFVRIGLVHN
ncbi:sulfatase-like hydrolase/transferase [Lacrimispora sp.]|uniref:sulfatase-like hydrolase/transferase n=1 Tax=Lacrimispora sp. TaxID=2719234 RepID=UPI0028A85B32|nr:sulfatase-like hydrolase/transferase [Lacrimispora sp.]